VAKAKTKRQALQKLREIRILEESEADCKSNDDQALMVRLGYPPRPYDVWNFPDLDDRFGRSCPGNIPAGLVFNLLYFFTSRGDLVVDPMAGGGVVGDSCKAMGRRCLMYELEPLRPDIDKHDLRDGWPSGAGEADLVFLDPPYYKKREADYGTNSISSLDRGEYLGFFGKLAENIHKSDAARVAFLMSDYTDDEDPRQSIFIWHYVALFKGAGWIPERHIMAPLSTEQIHPDFIIKFREARRLGKLGRSLVVFKRGD